MLATTPDYDPATHLLRLWTAEVIEEARMRGIKPLRLDGKDVTKEKFGEMVGAHNPSFLLLNGHGSGNSVFGQRLGDGTVAAILAEGDNDGILAGRIAYARACSSSFSLGASCVGKGARAYIGYRGAFIITSDANMASRPQNDRVANYFKEITNVIPIAIIKGNSAGEAVLRSRAACAKIIQHLESGEHYTPEAQAILPLLYIDMQLLDLKGDADAQM